MSHRTTLNNGTQLCRKRYLSRSPLLLRNLTSSIVNHRITGTGQPEEPDRSAYLIVYVCPLEKGGGGGGGGGEREILFYIFYGIFLLFAFRISGSTKDYFKWATGLITIKNIGHYIISFIFTMEEYRVLIINYFLGNTLKKLKAFSCASAALCEVNGVLRKTTNF